MLTAVFSHLPRPKDDIITRFLCIQSVVGQDSLNTGYDREEGKDTRRTDGASSSNEDSLREDIDNTGLDPWQLFTVVIKVIHQHLYHYVAVLCL